MLYFNVNGVCQVTFHATHNLNVVALNHCVEGANPTDTSKEDSADEDSGCMVGYAEKKSLKSLGGV